MAHPIFFGGREFKFQGCGNEEWREMFFYDLYGGCGREENDICRQPSPRYFPTLLQRVKTTTKKGALKKNSLMIHLTSLSLSLLSLFPALGTVVNTAANSVLSQRASSPGPSTKKVYQVFPHAFSLILLKELEYEFK